MIYDTYAFLNVSVFDCVYLFYVLVHNICISHLLYVA